MAKLTLILSFTWKFALTFPLAIFGMKLGIAETITLGNIGGALGVIFFAFLSDGILKIWENMFSKSFRPKKKKKKFNKRNRKLVRIKSRYGLLGIVILNPVVLSIPVSTFLVRKYYSSKFINLAWLVVGQIAWSLIYVYFYFYIKKTI